MDSPPIVCVERARRFRRVEPIALALLCRLLVRGGSLDRAVRLLDRLPRAAVSSPIVAFPRRDDFRGAGACLALSLARSQYLRRRGATSTIVIGAQTVEGDLDAHAWLEPFDDDAVHSVLHRIER